MDAEAINLRAEIIFVSTEEIRQLVREEDRCEGYEVVPDTGLECLEEVVEEVEELVNTCSLTVFEVDVIGYFDSFFLFLFLTFFDLICIGIIFSIYRRWLIK